MTKAVSKKASEMTTESGGEVAVPSAVRNGDSTTTMGQRKSSSPGSTARAAVRSVINWMTLVQPAAAGAPSRN
jgi:hypothetical protein